MNIATTAKTQNGFDEPQVGLLPCYLSPLFPAAAIVSFLRV